MQLPHEQQVQHSWWTGERWVKMRFGEDLGPSAASSPSSGSRKEGERHKSWAAPKPGKAGSPLVCTLGQVGVPHFVPKPAWGWSSALRRERGAERGESLGGGQARCAGTWLGGQQKAVARWGRGAAKAGGQGVSSLGGSPGHGSSHYTGLRTACGERPLGLCFPADRPRKGLCHTFKEYLFEFRVSKIGVYSLYPLRNFLFFNWPPKFTQQ